MRENTTDDEAPAREPRGKGTLGKTDFKIGERLRALRSAHRISMRQLSVQAGVSVSMISQVERGLVEPSISVLKRIASSLDTTLTYFFSDKEEAEVHIVRRDKRRSLHDPERGSDVDFELLIPEAARLLEPIYGRYKPGASMGGEPIVHEGEEWGIVLKGRLKVWLNDELLFLEAGDSIWFASTEPHRFANALDDEQTEYIWVSCPSSF